VILSRSLADQLVAHAKAEFPNECCGLIAGNGQIATRILRAENTEASPFMYVMDPREQMRLIDDIDDAGEEMLAIYHSHTRSAAYPSRTDVELAFYADPLYVIVSLRDEEPVIRAFKLFRDGVEGAQIEESPVEIS
jgi:[CysO sulfur-carrier protein]-S-L-cysteine hydrolase